jgi:spermidine synthase
MAFVRMPPSTMSAASPSPPFPPEKVRGLRRLHRPLPREGWLPLTLVLLFFFSGISALIYQVLWLRLLGLVFGVTLYAATTVLASFMAGLGLGSFAAGRLVGRSRRPIAWYGAAEILIGVAALASPIALEATEKLYVVLHPGLPGTMLWQTAVRFILSGVVLLVPTTLMGATVPIVVKSWPARRGVFGQRVSVLYSANTAGAVVGALLAGFGLVGDLGIGASFRLAALLNVVVGVVATIAAWTMPLDSGRPALPTAEAPDVVSAEATVDRVRRMVLAVFALSGFVSLALEVVWFRMLVLFAPATTYAFTMMLATVLFGIAAGSGLVAPLMRRRQGNWAVALAILEVAIGLVVVYSLAVLPWAYGGIIRVAAWLSRLFLPEVAMIAALSLLVILPAALLMGVAFPVGLRLWAAEDAAGAGRAARRTGLFYSVNLLGAILGAMASGFFLVPQLGIRGSLVLLALISAASGLLLLTVVEARAKWVLGLAAVGGVVVGCLLTPNPVMVALARRYPGERLLWNEDGLQATVTVQERADGVRALYLDGLPQADSAPATVKIHREIGHLPMLLHPHPTRVLVIGLGGGATAAAVASHEGAHIDVVELSETVVRGAGWLRPAHEDVIQRRNVTLRIDDGRNYLLLTPERYDVITADIIRPDRAGSGNLYSVEYFRLARRALKDDGLMLQWIPRRSAAQYALIVRTFLTVFPETTLWAEGRLMVGGKRPLRLDAQDFERKRQSLAMDAVLAEVGLDSFPALLSRYVAGPAELREFVGAGLVVTDDRPLVEYFLSLPTDDVPVDLTPLLSRRSVPREWEAAPVR